MNESPDKSMGSTRGAVVAAVGIFVIAVAVRAGYAIYSAADGAALTFDDERWYWALGKSYAAGGGFVGEFGHRAERMPLYPWLLSAFAGLDGGIGWARLMQCVLGGLAAPLTYMLARTMGRGAGLAGLMVACDPALVGSASLLLTETLHVTALTGLWLIAWPLRRSAGDRLLRWLAVGIAAALCVYLREASLVFVALLGGHLLIARRDRRAVAGVLMATTVVVLALAPWAYRNSRVIGSWCWLTTRGGISLYDGVRPGATGAGDLAGVKDAAEVAGLTEVAWDRHFREASWRVIGDEPTRIVALAPGKLARTWSPILHAAEYETVAIRVIFAGWYVPLYAAALLGLWIHRRQTVLWWYALMPAIGVCMLHAVFVGSVRYRLPAMPMLAVLAALGMAAAYDRWRHPAARIEAES